MFLSLTNVKTSTKDFNWKTKYYCLIIIGVESLETNRLYIYHFASKVCGQKYCHMWKKSLYNHPKPYFFKKLLWSHFWIDFNKYQTKAFRIVYLLIVYLFIMFIRVIKKLPNSEQSYKGKVKTHKKQTKSVNNRKTVKTVMTLTWCRHF